MYPMSTSIGRELLWAQFSNFNQYDFAWEAIFITINFRIISLISPTWPCHRQSDNTLAFLFCGRQSRKLVRFSIVYRRWASVVSIHSDLYRQHRFLANIFFVLGRREIESKEMSLRWFWLIELNHLVNLLFDRKCMSSSLAPCCCVCENLLKTFHVDVQLFDYCYCHKMMTIRCRRRTEDGDKSNILPLGKRIAFEFHQKCCAYVCVQWIHIYFDNIYLSALTRVRLKEHGGRSHARPIFFMV